MTHRSFKSHPDAQREGKSGSLRVLVIDDESDMRRYCSEVLLAMDYLVETANDGEGGWKALQNGEFDLVITDLYMPGISGVELVVKMRAAGLRLPVILMTGDIKLREEDAVFDGTLVKPFTPVNLLDAVEQILGSDTGEDSIESP